MGKGSEGEKIGTGEGKGEGEGKVKTEWKVEETERWSKNWKGGLGKKRGELGSKMEGD